jgi:colanic acid biosynthesis glycosyl transferase WcaI
VLAEHLSHRAATVDLVSGSTPGATTLEPDLVVGITRSDGDAGCAAGIARRSCARLVLVVRGLTRETPDAVAESLRAADRVTIPSDSFRHELRARGVDDHRIALLPPWAGSAPSSLDRSDARRRLGWPERAFVAVHSGPLDPAHDLDQLVEAARLLRPGTLVVITGDGPARSSLQARAEDVGTLLFPPPLGAEDQALALVAADAVIVTEPVAGGNFTVPGELSSGLSAGRPVVAAATAAGAVGTELARAGGAGLLVPPGEPSRLAEALLALHADPCRRVAMGLAAIAHAENQLSRGAVLARFDRIVDAALGSPRPAERLPA